MYYTGAYIFIVFMGIEYEYSSNIDLNYLIAELENPKPLLRAIASYQKSQVSQHIALGVDAYGDKFEPLESRYAYVKEVKYGRKPVLVASGKMIGSLYQNIGLNTLTVGFSDPVANYHQEGSDILPKRQMLPSSDRGLPILDQEKYIDLTLKYIEQSTKAAIRK